MDAHSVDDVAVEQSDVVRRDDRNRDGGHRDDRGYDPDDYRHARNHDRDDRGCYRDYDRGDCCRYDCRCCRGDCRRDDPGCGPDCSRDGGCRYDCRYCRCYRDGCRQDDPNCARDCCRGGCRRYDCRLPANRDVHENCWNCPAKMICWRVRPSVRRCLGLASLLTDCGKDGCHAPQPEEPPKRHI